MKLPHDGAARRRRGCRLLAFGFAVGSLPVVCAMAPTKPIFPANAVQGPDDVTLEAGRLLLLTAVATGDAPVTYQWMKDGRDIIGASGTARMFDPGTTFSPAAYSATLMISNAGVSDSGTYIVTFKNNHGTSLSRAAVVRIVVPAVAEITTQPVSTTVEAGGSATFSVVATGTTLSYQWRKNGVPIPGANSAQLVISNAAISDGGAYSVVVTGGGSTATSDSAVLTVRERINVPSIRPLDVAVAERGTFQLTIENPSAGGVYQWKKNGVAIAGATTTSLTIAAAAVADMGFYSVSVVENGQQAESAVSIVTVDAAANASSRLGNLSARGFVPAAGAFTVGFAVRGGDKPLLVRAIGPGPADFGIAGTLADPRIRVATASNDDWDSALAPVFSAAGAFQLRPGSRDAAVVATLPAGAFTAEVTSKVATDSGIVLAEIYDTDPKAAGSVVNLSAMAFAGVGAQALAPGFLIDGAAAKLVLIRAIGPTLANFGVLDALRDPRLAILPAGLSTAVRTNDDWDGSAAMNAAFDQVAAFRLPVGSKDAALTVRLPPGGYTLEVSGVGGSIGTVLVEIYDLDRGADR